MDNQLDPQVVNLAKSIRQTESGGNFASSGKSGEYGAYQFTPDTWNKYSSKYGINAPLNQATPEQQNAVAYNKIKEWKDSGKDVTQIASMWNAGEGEPNAYTGKFSDGSLSTGKNKKGVNFDVPAYAKSVATAYQKLKGGGQVGADPNNPSSVASTQNANVKPQDDTYGASFPSSPNDSILGGTLKTIGNIPSSALNFGKSIFNMVQHPIDTSKGIISAAAGGAEEGYNSITGSKTFSNDRTKTFDSLVGALKNRYGSLDNLQKTATNDPVGFGTDILAVLEGGAGLVGKIGGVDAVGALNRGLSTVAKPVAGAIKATASTPFKLAARTLGLETGVGYDAIKTGMQASTAGGDAMKAFTKGLRGGANPEEVVGQARGALDEIVNQRSQEYNKMLSSIKSDPSTYDISPALREVDKQLNKFNILKNSDGTLDFSRSAIGEGADATKIQQIYDDLKSWGTKAGDRTAPSLDVLKKRIGNYYSPNSDIRAFTTATKSAVSDILDKAPGYTDAMKNYSMVSDQISEIRKGLSLGDKVATETTFKKLIGAFKGNNEIRKQFIQELDQVSGGQLLPGLAGQQLSSALPRGLAGYLEGGLGAVAGLSQQVGIVPLLVMAMTTSPRIVGEFVRALGIGTSKVNSIMNILNRFALPATVGGGLVNRITPSPQQ